MENDCYDSFLFTLTTPYVTHILDFRTDDSDMLTFLPRDFLMAVAPFVLIPDSAVTWLFVLVSVSIDRVWRLSCI